MSDFRSAFEKGQEAAIKADMARKEIDQVFYELSKQLGEATDGKLELRREEFQTRPKDTLASVLTNVLSPRWEYYWAIAAFNPKAKDNSRVELAKWEQSRSGYPCKLSWGGSDHRCHDRESLEASLALLLEDAWVGEKLRSLILRPPPETPKPASSDQSEEG